MPSVEDKTHTAVSLSSYTSVLVLYTYDYLLNFSREVELMWPGPFHHVGTALYFTTRYLPFVKLVYELASVYVTTQTTSPIDCTVGMGFIDAFHILSRTSITLVLFAQTYAVFNQSWIILATVGPLGIALIVMDGIESAANTNCPLLSPSDRKLHTTLSLLMLTAFPTAVMILTLYRVVDIARHKSNFRQTMRKGAGLTGLMLFETVCMSGVCLLRLFNTLWFLLAPTTVNLVLNPFALPVAAIFIAHFLLSLREIQDRHSPGEPTTTNQLALTTFPLDVHADLRFMEDVEEVVFPSRRREVGEEHEWDSSEWHESTQRFRNEGIEPADNNHREWINEYDR